MVKMVYVVCILAQKLIKSHFFFNRPAMKTWNLKSQNKNTISFSIPQNDIFK